MGANGAIVNVTPTTAATAIQTGSTYTLMHGAATSNFNTILATGKIVLGTNPITVGTNTYLLSLSSTNGQDLILTVASVTANALTYWKGGTDSSWTTTSGTAPNPTNWVASLNGTVDNGVPGSTPSTTNKSNVYITASNASNFMPMTLDANFNISSLNYPNGGSAYTSGSTLNSGAAGRSRRPSTRAPILKYPGRRHYHRPGQHRDANH